MFEKPAQETGDLYFTTADYLATGEMILLNILFRIPENGMKDDLDIEYCARAAQEGCDLEFTDEDIAALKSVLIASEAAPENRQ